MISNAIEHYRKRERTERSASDFAACVEARLAHLGMAERYADLMNRLEEDVAPAGATLRQSSRSEVA